MSKSREPAGAREASRERPDLCQQYRPIGIGAVAAALSVMAMEKEEVEREPTTQDNAYRPAYRGYRYFEPIAA